MKKIVSTTIVVLSLLSLNLPGSELLPIDNLFVKSLASFYRDADKIKKAIWPGMQMAPVCLFRTNGPALIYNHPDPPESFEKISEGMYVGEQSELELFGATQKKINGTWTAIVDYGLDHYSRPEEVYAELFHELHHVFQRNSLKKLEYDNPAILLTYPENSENDGIKLFEQKLLFDMCFTDDATTFRKRLDQFFTCRLKRKNIIGAYSHYEETVENMEGPAFFCEYRFFNQNARISEARKKNYNHKHFWGVLTTPFFGRQNLRLRHLAAGMAMCFLLERHFPGWQQAYYSGKQPLYAFFVSKFTPQEVELKISEKYHALSHFHTRQEILKHQDSYKKFSTQPGTRIVLAFDRTPQFRGFDPMNAEAINETTILHRTLLNLSGKDNAEVYITHGKAVTIVDGEIWFVKKVILFAKEDDIYLKKDKIIVKANGCSISWKGELESSTSDKVVFRCR